MPAANPLTNYGSRPLAPPDHPAAALDEPMPPDFAIGADAGGFGVAVAGDFTHPENTNTHVALLVAAALVVIVVFHIGGFRFAVDAGVASR